jgi:diguanylate cyclase (GGDEF)-like protein
MREHVLERRANYDELTGHLNRSRLRESLSHAIAYNERYKETGAYIAVGLDKLSMINDGFGHEVADAVIVGAGQRIERCLRVTDTIGRIGGDRFGIVLANCDREGMQIAAEKILEAFRKAPVETPSSPISITVSIGGALFPTVARTAHDSMTAAESALQEAKTRGRNCFIAFELTDAQRRQQRENMNIGEAVLRALDSGRIRFAYQPVIEARTGRIAYYETLLRMTQPDGTLQTAGAFVPVAEKLGLMRLLDKRALELAIDDLLRYPDVVLALNVSSLTVTDQSWMRGLVGAVRGRPDLADRLMVEITETAAMEDFDVSAQFVAALRELGCKVALDDFGAGYTSFRHMKSLPVDVVKIDGSFVQNLHSNSENLLFIKTLRGLAQGFGFTTVAECVEIEEEAVLLREAGIDFLQGYLFGRPVVDPPWRVEPDAQAAPIPSPADGEFAD